MKQFSKLLREILPCPILLGTTLARKDPLNPTQSGCSALHKYLCKEELVRILEGLGGGSCLVHSFRHISQKWVSSSVARMW